MTASKAAIWIVPIVLLILAFMPMPYGYYKLLRLVIAATCTYLAFRGGHANQGWPVIFGTFALIYNPIWPLHLGKDTWVAVNIATIFAYGTHFLRTLQQHHAA